MDTFITAWIAHAFFWFTGARNLSGTAEGLLQGIGGAAPSFLLPIGFFTWYYKHTCHEKPSCLRWGKYEVAGGLGKKCHVHHPDFKGISKKDHGAHLDLLHDLWRTRDLA